MVNTRILPAVYIFQAFINGEYDAGSDPLTARVCQSASETDNIASNADLTAKSNYRCGRKGVYLFKTEGR